MCRGGTHPGAKAPKLVRREHLKTMKPGAVLVDVAIDQGGCFETSTPPPTATRSSWWTASCTTAWPNMPGAYSRTATFALNNATIAYGSLYSQQGWEQACGTASPCAWD